MNTLLEQSSVETAAKIWLWWEVYIPIGILVLVVGIGVMAKLGDWLDKKIK